LKPKIHCYTLTSNINDGLNLAGMPDNTSERFFAVSAEGVNG